MPVIIAMIIKTNHQVIKLIITHNIPISYAKANVVAPGVLNSGSGWRVFINESGLGGCGQNRRVQVLGHYPDNQPGERKSAILAYFFGLKIQYKIQ